MRTFWRVTGAKKALTKIKDKRDDNPPTEDQKYEPPKKTTGNENLQRGFR